MKTFLITIIFLILASCTQKIIVARVEVNQDKFQKNYNTCLTLLSSQNIKDSTTLRYYKKDCEKEAKKEATELNKYLLYRRGEKTIKEIKIK